MKKILLIGALIGFTTTLFGIPQKPTDDLIIILDYGQSEELLRTGSSERSSQGHVIEGLAKLGAMTSTLIPALYQKVAPILVSRSLLFSLLTRKQIFEDFLTKDLTQLSRLYDRQSVTQAPSLSLFKQHCLYAQKMYAEIHKELTELSKQQSDTHTAMRTLAAKHSCLEASAPRTLQVYSGEKRSLKDTLHKELQAYALCYYAPLTLENYVIKEVSEELILLLPRLNTPDIVTYNAGTPITPLEKQLGLKVNHLKDVIDTKRLLHPTPITHGMQLVESFRNIFVTKKEGGTHVWAIYFTGHGLPSYPERRKIEHLTLLKNFYAEQLTIPQRPEEKRTVSQRHRLMQEELTKTELKLAQLPKSYEKIICSLTVDEFKKVLLFLQLEVETSLLLYTSCYGGGEHLISPYQGNTKILKYDCIAGSLSDTVSFQTTPMLLLPPYRSSRTSSKTIIEGINHDSIDLKNKRLAPLTSIHFDEFFMKARDPKRDAFTLIHCLHPYTEQGKMVPDSLENIALERPAGSTSFTVVRKGDSVSPASSKALGTSVDVALLTQPRYGQLTLAEQIPSFVSLLEGPAYHVIDFLEAGTQSLGQLAMSFLGLPTLSTPKVFWIKKLTCKRENPPPFFLPLEFVKPLIRGRESSQTVLHDVIITRNVPTTEAIKHEAFISIYFSDSQGTTWYLPIKKSWGTSSKITNALAHGELYTLFPGLREATR